MSVQQTTKFTGSEEEEEEENIPELCICGLNVASCWMAGTLASSVSGSQDEKSSQHSSHPLMNAPAHERLNVAAVF